MAGGASEVDLDGDPEGQPAPSRRRFFTSPRQLRLWLLVVPIHAAAFVGLYLATLSLLERGYAAAGAEAARARLDQAVREMPFFVPRGATGRSPHVFDHLLVAHAAIGLRLYGPTGEPLGSRAISADPADRELLAEFLRAAGAERRVWVEHEGERDFVRGFSRLVADTGCMPCHEAGKVLGVASMRLDYTQPLAEGKRGLRSQVALVVGAWIALAGAVSMAVQRSVRRSAAKLEADLHAATSGEGDPGDETSGGLVLDPVAAEVHRGLRRFLERQRARDAEVAGRLAHVDQLASLGELAAGLAHEIKNPLAGIQGALEVLRDETAESDTAGLYDEMLNELHRVNGILQRLLESARPAPLRRVRTDPVKLLAETVDFLAPAMRRRGVQLVVETADELPALELDPAKIRQVLVNLVQNAAEAMPEGGEVTLRASGLGEGAVLAVADNGPGIAAADLDHVFEPFFTTKFTGTGLGLAISRSLVAQHGGRIEVDSELGRGTTFFVIFPTPGADPQGSESAS